MIDLRISKYALLPALSWVTGIVARKTTLPILEHLLLRTDGQRLSIRASSLDIEAEASAALDAAAEYAEITLPARRLLDIVRSVEDGPIRITTPDDGRALLAAGRSRFRLGTLPTQDFPRMETPSHKARIEVPAASLARMLKRTHHAMAAADVRWYLNGLFFEFGAEGVRAVATDGHRLATHVEPLDTPPEQDATALIPTHAVRTLASMVEKNNAAVRIDLHEGHVVFQVGDARLAVRPIDGRYPDWRRVVPSATGPVAIINRNALELALARVGLVSDEKYKGARFTLALDSLTLECSVKGTDSHAKVEMDVDFPHAAYTVGLNLAYLDDVLAHLDADSIAMAQQTDGRDAMLITPVDDDRTQAIIMPMNL